MSTDFNTRLISFTNTMSFVAFGMLFPLIIAKANLVLGIPIPGFVNTLTYPERDETLQTNRRSLLSYPQYGNSLNGDAQQVFFATILWWAIALFGFTLVFGAVLFIVGLAKGAKNVFIARIFHVALRLVALGYFPIVVVAAAHSKAGWGVNIIASVVALVCDLIGLTAALNLVLSLSLELDSLS